MSSPGTALTLSGTGSNISFKDVDNVWTGYVGFDGNTGQLSFPGRNVLITAGYNGTIELSDGASGYNAGKVYVPYGNLIVENGNIGINTASPAQRLDVNGPAAFGATTQTYIGDAGSTPTVSYGMFHQTGLGLGIVSGAGGSTQGTQFWNHDGANYFASMIITGGSGNVGIGTTNPGYKLEVNGSTNIGGTLTTSRVSIDSAIVFDTKTMTMTDSFSDALTVSMNDHTGCYVKITAFGDWGNHSSVAYLGEFFLQNGAGAYNEPGRIIRQVDNTNTDHIEAQIVDPSGTSGARSFVIQLRATATASFTAALQYEVRGQFNSVS